MLYSVSAYEGQERVQRSVSLPETTGQAVSFLGFIGMFIVTCDSV